MDRGIPRRPRNDPHRREWWPTSGWFTEDRSGRLVLKSRRGHVWPLRFVTIQQGWGAADNSEGSSKLPRRRVYDAQGQVVVPGDIVVIWPEEHDPKRVIAVPGVRGGNVTDPDLPYNQLSEGASENRLFGRLRPLDPAHQPMGFVEWDCAPDAVSATVRVQETGVSRPPDTGWTEVCLEQGRVRVSLPSGAKVIVEDASTGPKVKLGSAEASEPYILSTALFRTWALQMAALDGFMESLVAANSLPGAYTAAAAAYTVAAKLPGSFESFAADLAASVGPGGPFTSRVVDGE